MSSERRSLSVATIAAMVALSTAPVNAQVTTASIGGRVITATGTPVPTATVTAVHQPSGTTYRATPRADGRFTIANMRVGGPYTVTVRALGFSPGAREGIALTLGNQTELDFTLTQAALQLQAVQVTATAGALSSERTGAQTRIAAQAIQQLPTITRTINDFTRLTPQASGNGGFLGQDNRLNNITVDGSFFNNSFGLAGQPGGRTNVAPIPLDAIEQLQVNIAPYDVRQGNFVGAGVNAVTRSGTNNFEGSLYYFTRDQSFNGTQARTNPVPRSTFDFSQIGARLGGPILRNRLFFFASFEDDGLQQPGTQFQPRPDATVPAEGNVTRVLASDVTRLATFLRDSLSYEPGQAGGWTNETPSRRYLAKLDFNANERNKLSVRYSQLRSVADINPSASNALGFGNRLNNNSLSFSNSRYGIIENIDSFVGEWNATAGRLANNLIVGYTMNDESREARGSFFPTVDILDGAQTYLNFGFEPFTPANQLRYRSFQVQNNLQYFLNRHEVTVGGFFERYRSENVFFPGSQGVWTYNSLDDFLADARGFLANPDRTTSPVQARRFQYRFNNIPGQVEPLQPLTVNSYGFYAQDRWRPNDRVTLTIGLRADLPVLSAPAFVNEQANARVFRDPNGGPVQFRTQDLPQSRALLSPRLGFNWDVRGDRATQLRGGTGVFTGRPPFVWISNQLGQNGILTGLIQLDSTTAHPFTTDPSRFAPQQVTGAPAPSYELNTVARNFRFPQQWRSNVAVDQRLPWGVLGTAEFIYGRDLNGATYYDANLPVQPTFFAGPDTRARFLSNRIYPNVARNIVLDNQNDSYNYNIAVSLEKSFARGLFAKAAYSYGQSFTYLDPGSTAGGSFNSLIVPGNPNRPPLSRSTFAPGHRAITALSYRREYFRFGATTLSLFGEGSTIGYASYVVGGDLNGDGVANNDLLYVPRDRSEMNFLPLTITSVGRPTVVVSPQAQADAFEAYINQDRYLRTRRGQYTERNGVQLPLLVRADLVVAQDIFRNVFGRRQNLQVRLDIQNVGNLINSDWGVSQRVINNQPLAAAGVDAAGRPTYRFRNIGPELLTQTFQPTASVFDVYRMQLGVRYLFQ
jgi:hypothetical protein